MSTYNNQSKVLIPKRIIDKRASLGEETFREEVIQYLKRYPDYLLIEVVDNLALCERHETI